MPPLSPARAPPHFVEFVNSLLHGSGPIEFIMTGPPALFGLGPRFLGGIGGIGGGGASSFLASDPRDYVQDSQQLNAVLGRLFRLGGHSGPPPASKAAVERLPRITVDSANLATWRSEECVVCKDAFEAGAQLLSLPCKHAFHCDCIKPWLDKNNTCPTCRFKLPSEVQDGAARSPPSRRRHREAASDASSSSSRAARRARHGNSSSSSSSLSDAET